MLETYPSSLADVITELVGTASKLGARLHPKSAASLAELVCVTNYYYSNLIEGHNTRPRDIERALADDLDGDAQRRDLQIEARAHIRVQREVDALCSAGGYLRPWSAFSGCTASSIATRLRVCSTSPITTVTTQWYRLSYALKLGTT